MFSGRCVNDQVLLFNEIFLSIMISYVRNKELVFDDRESSQFDRKIKKLISYGNQTYNKIPKQIYKTHPKVKQITILNLAFDIFEISLTPESIRLNKIL